MRAIKREEFKGGYRQASSFPLTPFQKKKKKKKKKHFWDSSILIYMIKFYVLVAVANGLSSPSERIKMRRRGPLYIDE